MTDVALRQLGGLDRPVQARIFRYLRERVATAEDPRRFGKALRGPRAGFWRYRVGDYRVICRIEDEAVVVLVVAAADPGGPEGERAYRAARPMGERRGCFRSVLPHGAKPCRFGGSKFRSRIWSRV